MIARSALFILVAILVTWATPPERSQAFIRGGYTTNLPPSSCPQGTSFADGCASPANAPIQHTNFFTGYTGTTYPARPPWNVAGVDFAVGQNSSGTALADPLTASVPSGWTRNTSSQTYTCSGTNPGTLSGMDFSLEGGWQVLDNGSCAGSVTITNNYFAIGSFADSHFFYFIHMTSGTESVINFTYNTLDGNGCNFGNQSAMFLFNTQNTSLTFEYNWLLNSADQGLQMEQNGGTTTNITMNYNLMEVYGYASGGHNQWIWFGNPASSTTWSFTTETFNTVYVPATPGGTPPASLGLCSGGTLAGGQTGPFYHSPSTPGFITAVTASNNTIINPIGTGGSQNGDLIRADDAGTVGTYTVQNNWMDDSGAFGYFTSSGASSTKTCTGNKNIINNTAITGTVGGMSCS